MPKFQIRNQNPQSRNNIKTNNDISRINEIASILDIPSGAAMELSNLFTQDSFKKLESELSEKIMLDELNLQLVQDFKEEWISLFGYLAGFEKEILDSEMRKIENNIEMALQCYWGPLATVKIDRATMAVECLAPGKESLTI